MGTAAGGVSTGQSAKLKGPGSVVKVTDILGHELGCCE